MQLLKLNKERIIVDSEEEPTERPKPAADSDSIFGLSSDFSAKRMGDSSSGEGSGHEEKMVFTKNIIRGIALSRE